MGRLLRQFPNCLLFKSLSALTTSVLKCSSGTSALEDFVYLFILTKPSFVTAQI